MAQRPNAPRPHRAATHEHTHAETATHWMGEFLEALADTSNVSAAARKASIDVSTAYQRRRHDHEFNRRWQIALCEGYDNLEMELLYRLRTGELKPVTSTKRASRTFDNATAFRLLAAHRESAARERARRDHVSAEEIRAAIDRKVDELRKRVMDAKAQREAAALAPAILPKPRDPA
ncbi:hypothetical protein AQZ52_01290 [Novosphingobium fuchskuhlense]|uniref:Terminase n=1 Tax=Novosphingobium fuchskuhlense TaxID=1117702 RepID=A0A117UZC0_9SPHN|nr:hypothetical protein [Novosphingobium fuchskuhlense]KUR73632.1 hypothetical protein AQZ52_01290 [Novosphingobium fuchskuhlense]